MQQKVPVEPKFLEHIAKYTGLDATHNTWPTLSFPSREHSEKNSVVISQEHALDKLRLATTNFGALRIALITAQHMYNYFRIDGDQSGVVVELNGGPTMAIMLGRPPEELLQFRIGEISEALEYTQSYESFAQKLLLKHDHNLPLSTLKRLEEVIDTAILTEPPENSRQILLECGQIIKASEESFRPFMEFVQTNWDSIVKDQEYLNEFVTLYLKRCDADVSIFAIGNDIIRDAEQH